MKSFSVNCFLKQVDVAMCHVFDMLNIDLKKSLPLAVSN